MMDAEPEPVGAEVGPLSISSQTATGISTLTNQASSLQRLDDKLATGMTITDVANVRWLTAVEVLQYLDKAAAANYADYPLMTMPPASPPTTGTLLLYNSVETPNYAQDGIEWVADPGVKWKSIERVLARYGAGSGSGTSDSDSTTEASGSNIGMNILGGGGMSEGGVEGSGSGSQHSARGSSEESSSAMATGASAEYLSCATRNTFHRREYRGPNNIVLLHYLDSVRALRMTSELVDRIVLLSADADTSNLPPVAPEIVGGKSNPEDVKMAKDANLGETMNILMEMVDEHEASGTVVAEAVEEHVLKAATDAALSAVMKHVAPKEAVGVVDAMEVAMEDIVNGNDIGGVGGDVGEVEDDDDDDVVGGSDGNDDGDDGFDVEDVTALEIDEAITQVLSGNSPEGGDGMEDDNKEGSSKRSVSSSSGSGGASKGKNTAEIIEDRILDSMEEVLPDELKWKLINTTEIMLDAAGVSLKGGKVNKKAPLGALLHNQFDANSPPGAPTNGAFIGSPNSTAPTTGPDGSPTPSSGNGHALPEIIDITPEFHVNGYQPLTYSGKARKGQKLHKHSMVLSTATPIPSLPPYVDQYYTWERYAAFVDFQEVADDPQVRNVSFNRMNPLTPYSYKVKMPTDIPNYSIRHIVVVGVLLPKDHRVKRNLRGIELALKLTLQTEWMAASDLFGAYANSRTKAGEIPSVKGIKRPVFFAPCGGARLQLLSQISKHRFTMYPASSLPESLSNAVSPDAAPNFVQRVAIKANEKNDGTDESMKVKRKRDNYFEEWAAAPGIDANMTTAEVDRHRKVRFVERIANTITTSKGESDALIYSNLDTSGTTTLDGKPVEDMPEDEVDQLLGRVLMRYIEVCIEKCDTREELLGEINWSGYSGLSMLHHACFYNFMPLITLLLNKGGDPNILSSEGDLTPMHFAAAGGYKEVVEVLIRNGSNPCQMDVTGDTPADHARKAGHVEVAAMLDAYNEQAGIVRQESANAMDVSNAPHSKTTDVFLQSAFKDLSLKDKLGLNLFVDRSKAAPMAFVQKPSTSMITDGDGEYLENTAFSFISDEDRAKLREAMSLASEMDLKEMNMKAEHQDVRRYLRQSNYEAISAASKAMDKARKKESDILKNATENAVDPSKMQLSRALAMLVLRKNLPTT